MSEEKISSYVDQGAFKADTDFIKGQLQVVYDQFLKISSLKVSLTPDTSLKETTKVIDQIIASENKLSDSVKNTAAAHKETEKAAKAAADAQTANAKAAKAAVEAQAAAAKAATAKAAADSQAAAAAAKAAKAAADAQAADFNELTKKTDTQVAAEQRLAQARRDQVKTVIAQTDAYKALDLQYQKAATNAKALQAQARVTGAPEDQAKADDASAYANGLANQLKSIDSTVGQAQRNVGNYTGALKVLEEVLGEVNAKLSQQASINSANDAKLKEATTNVTTLQNALAIAEQKLQQLNSGGGQGNSEAIKNQALQVNNLKTAVASATVTVTDYNTSLNQSTDTYANLSREADLLSTIVNQQQAGFTSVTQEIRNDERALQSLRAAGLEGSEGFEKLREATVAANQSQKEFQRQQKLLESEAPQLKALTLAAKALGGTYAIGAGAAALFADGNEKVEKEINKLVAIMTILQGLNEAYEFIQQGGAIATAFKTTQMGLLTAATEIYAGATEGATIATESFTAAFIATGIGAVIVAVATAVGFLVAYLVEMAQAEDKAVKAQKELSDITKELNENLKKEIDLIGQANKEQIESLKRQAEAAQALGNTQAAQLAAKQKIADLDAQQAKTAFATSSQLALNDIQRNEFLAKQAERTKDLLALNNKIKNGQIDIFDAIKERERISSQFTASTITKENALAAQRDQHLQEYSDGLKKLADLEKAQAADVKAGKEIPQLLKDKIAASKAALETSKAAADQETEIIDKRNSAISAQEVARNEIAKLSDDDRRKVILESVKLESDLITSKNNVVLNDDRSTLSQRLEALRSNVAAQRRVLIAERENVLNDPTTSEADKTIARKRAAEERKKIDLDEKESERKIGAEYDKRYRDARLSVQSDIINDQIKADESLLNEDKSQQSANIENLSEYLAKRQAALVDAYELKKRLLDLEHQNELADATASGKTAAELLAINVKYQEQETELERVYGKQRTDEIHKELDISLKYYENFYTSRKSQIDKEKSDEIVGLNNRNNNRTLSDKKYIREREKSEFEANQKSLEGQLKLDFEAQQLTKAGTPERTKANDDYAEHTLALSDLIHARKKQITEQEKQDTLESIDIIGRSYDVLYTSIGGLEQAASERRIANLQKQIDLNDKLKERGIRNLELSTLSSSQKAAEEIRLANLVDANNLSLQRKQRAEKRKEAEFDKTNAIAQILLNTAKGVAAAIPNVFLEVLAAAAGAAQLAVAISTPIPSYEKGTKSSGHGLALTDEAGPELYKKPSGEYFIGNSRPTFRMLEQGTEITPHHKLKEMIMNNMIVSANGKLQMMAEGGAGSYPDPSEKIDELKDTLVWHAAELKGAITGQRTKVVNHIHLDSGWGGYIKSRVTG